MRCASEKGRKIAETQQQALRHKALAHDLERVGSANASTYEMYGRIAEQEANELLAVVERPELGSGGEVVSAPADQAQAFLRDTLATPNALSLEASYRRTDLVSKAGVFESAVDAAESIDAGNSLEKMLAHQMALCHETAFGLVASAGNENNTVEKARLLNTATRLMATFQSGLQTLQRIRSGGRQFVTVQHVQVADGGQAVIAGNVQAGGARKAEGASKK